MFEDLISLWMIGGSITYPKQMCQGTSTIAMKEKEGTYVYNGLTCIHVKIGYGMSYIGCDI